jgi:YD repeat-containing protein
MQVLAFALGAVIMLASHIASAQIIPDYYSEPGLNPFREYVNQNASEYIDPFSGTLHLSYVDLLIPGNGGLDIKVQRSYTSVNFLREFLGLRTVTGVGWTMHFGRVLKSNQACEDTNTSGIGDNPVIELPDGFRHILTTPNPIPEIGPSPTPLWMSTSRWKAECDTSVSPPGFIVTSPEGVEYRMNKREDQYANVGTYSWYTTQIKDRNGNTINISYIDHSPPAYKLIHQVTSSDGRLVTFQYVDTGTFDVRLSSITANGKTWFYNYTKITDVFGSNNHYQLTSVVRPDGLKWVYAYNGRIFNGAGTCELQRVTFPYGGTISYFYDLVDFDPCPINGCTTKNTVVVQKVTGGTSITPGTWTFAYSPDWLNDVTGDVTTVTAPNGRYVYTHFGYTTAGGGTLWKVGLPLRKQTFTSSGALLETVDFTWASQRVSDENNSRPSRSGLVFDFEIYAPILTQKTVTRGGTAYTSAYSSHDVFGNPKTIVEMGNGTRATTLTYMVPNAFKWIINQVKNESIAGIGTISRDFDANGNLSSESRYGVATTYNRYSSGDVQTLTNARGHSTTYGTYKRGIPLTESQPEGRNLSRTVDNAGNVTSETNGEGFLTSYTYDGLNRLTAINHPVGNDVAISWTSTTRTSTRGDFREIQTFDGYGRVVQISVGPVSGTRIFRSIAYDAVGQKSFESAQGLSAPGAAGTRYTNDVLGRSISIAHVDTSGATAATRTIAYPAGSTLSVTDERGNVTSYSYLSFGNPDERYLTGITPPSGTNASTSIGRNLLGQINSVSQGVAGIGAGVVIRTYGYDSRMYLTSIDEPETGITIVGRDALGNMTSRTVGTSGTTSFEYDGQNRLTSIGYPNPARNVTQSWNRNNKLVTSSNIVSVRIWSYDANNNLTREELSLAGDSFAITYDYDANDQLSQITYPKHGSVVSYAPDVHGRPTAVAPFATSVDHHANGQVSAITYANGVTTTFGQDTQLRPSSIQSTKATSSYINLAYGYDAASNITSTSDSDNPNNNRTLTYDGIDRLASINGSVISYDGAGNILSQNFPSTLTYTHDGQKRLASTSGYKNYSFSYDVYGNVTSNGFATFQYNDASRLNCVNCSFPNQVEYDYDATGMRDLTRKSGITTYSMYASNGELMFEFNPSANVRREHIYLQGQRIATRATTAVFATSLSLTTSSSQIQPGQTVTLTATVTGQSPGGTVSFFSNGVLLGTGTVTGGAATLTTSPLNFGIHNFTATYSGDGTNLTSSSAAPSVVMAGNVPALIIIINSILLDD